MMLVKICGLKTAADAIDATNAGADLIGFVFANSKRQVSVTEAEVMIRKLPSTVKTVGVFVDTSIALINQVAKKVKLDYVQLHGHESVLSCQESDYPVIKGLRIETKEDLNHALKYLSVVDYLLLDGVNPGSGRKFDWNLLETMPIPREKIFLAGGLSPANVEMAIKRVQPRGVDVSSGVETDGKKDLIKINQFIKKVKEER